MGARVSKPVTEPFYVVVRGDEDGPGRVLARVLASSPAAAVERFRALRADAIPLELARGHRLDAIPLRALAYEGSAAGRGWTETEPGVFLYDLEAARRKILTYDAERHGGARA